MKTPPKHKSLWRTLNAETSQSFKNPIDDQADVVIIGAGISGLSTALLLAKANKRVTVLDMGETVASGDTGLSSAHLTHLLDAGYATLTQNFGQQAASQIAAVHQQAIDDIEATVREGDIDCGFARVPGFVFAPDSQGNKEVSEERESLQALGQPAEGPLKAPLSAARGEALKVPNQGQIDPVAYAVGLAQLIVKHGGTIHTGVRMTGYEKKDGRVVVHTSTNRTIQADDMVFATHTPPTKITLQTAMAPQRTYALAAKIADAPPAGLYFDTEEPYHYMRMHPDGAGSQLILGGCDHRVGAKQDTQESMAALVAYAHQHFKVEEITHTWSGQVFEPVDGLPYLGLLTGEKHIYVITGLSGNGLTSGTVGAKLCAASILGQAPQWAAIFAPSRMKPIASAVAFAEHNLSTSVHLIKDRVAGWLTSHNVAPGEGAVVRDGAHTAAIYNDGEQVHAVSPVCPHAGCYVAWNGEERSWDCPCHGSRFTPTGKLLCGPATSDLKPL
jgi:glycine/D-amino acid oxidase-like deaminating enzyme/nitrite reductase/ring-hydroxylating ferredoxin subunit